MSKANRNTRGTGGVVKIDGGFYARKRVAGEPVYGERRDTPEEAEADRLGWIKAGKQPKAKKSCPLMGDWALECIQGRWGLKIADSTHSLCETYRTVHLNASPIVRKRLNRITVTMLQEHIDGLEVNKIVGWTLGPVKERIVRREPASPSTKHRYAAYLSKLFSLAMKKGYVTSNPMSEVEKPEIPERVNTHPSIEKIGGAMEGSSRVEAIIVVYALTGLRVSELIRLEWGHIGDGTFVAPGTKNAKARAELPLPSRAAEAIKRQPKTGAFVFSTESGGALSRHNVKRDFKVWKAKNGIPASVRLQDLRGTFASLLIRSKTDLRTAMELLRHSNPRTTLKLYARSDDDARREASDSIEAAIKGAGEAAKTDRVSPKG